MSSSIIFPGQGSQHIGMGENFIMEYPHEIEKANEILEFDIIEMILKNPENKLNHTLYTQPLIYVVSCLSYLEYLKNNSKPYFVCGHSLGEYTALFAAEVFDFETGLRIVKKRAQLMDENKDGSMLAVMGESINEIDKILKMKEIKDVYVANNNSNEQVILSGIKENLELASQILSNYEYKCVPLPVSGAFHSPLMENARKEFQNFLAKFTFNPPTLQMISSTNAQLIDLRYILETLSFQLVRGVQWVKTILNMKEYGVRDFIEVGPGNVLTKLLPKIL